jgi:hypothetical protein
LGLDIYHVKLSARTSATVDYFLTGDFEDNPSFLKRYSSLITSVGEGPDIDKVIYYEEKGYQRKGVAAGFINVFENNKLYFQKEDVIRVKSFLKAENDASQALLEQRFQENFIDNFIEGESIFFINW